MTTLSINPFSCPLNSQASQEKINVRWINLNELKDDLTHTSEYFSERLKLFLNALTPIPSHDGNHVEYYQLWLNYPSRTLSSYQREFNLDLIVTGGSFDSNTLTQSSSGESDTSSFIHIKLFDEGEREEPLVHIRLNPDGTKGELVYIKKAKHMSGTQISDLTFFILNYLKADFIYLNDDSHYPIRRCSASAVLEMPIRMYLPIISSDGETWYGKRGFSPLHCKDLQTSDPSVVKTQDPTQYYLAVRILRNISLATLYRDVLEADGKTALLQLCKRNLPDINLENINYNIRRLASVKLYQLGNALYASLRTQQGQKDFYTFTQKIIAMKSDNPHPFYRSLSVLFETRIWKYSYKNALENTSFIEFESVYQ